MSGLAKKVCQHARNMPSHQTERRIIAFHHGKDYRNCMRELHALGIKPIKTDVALRFICCHTNRKVNWQQLSSHPRIAYIERDHSVKAHYQGTRRVTSRAVKASRIPWNIYRVKAPPVWRTANWGSPVKVAILDTGISRHPDLRIAGGVNTLTHKSYQDDHGHGTHVAGIAAATGNRRIYGTAPKVKLYAIKVLDASGSGFVTDIVEGIEWCLARGIKVLNMSFGLTADSITLRDAIRRARRRGAIMIASAGNSGTSLKEIDAPARYPETIAVAATTRNNRVAPFSSRGTGIDLSAPGALIQSTWLQGTYRSLSGTSMSTPHVTGAVALLRAIKPRIRPSQVILKLKQAARIIPGGRTAVGRGLLQVKPATRSLRS